jgi:spermidine/putrescine transport system substrate-binding protein
MKKILITLLVAALIAALVLSGCSGTTSGSSTSGSSATPGSSASDSSSTSGSSSASDSSSAGNAQASSVSGDQGGPKVLNIYNWTEYMPQSVYEQFEKETGIHPVESTFSSNEEMLAKLEAGGTGQYDMVVASTYIVPLMEQKGFIQKIDKSQISNFKNITPAVLGTSTDPGNDYTVPYMATMTVIAVNKQKIEKLGVTIKSLNDLLNPALKNNLVVVDDARELVDAALKANGKDPDSKDEATVEGMLPWLQKLKPNIKIFDSDSPKTALITNEVAAGLVYNLDAAEAIAGNSQIALVYTTEPCEAAVDNFVITSTSKHKDYAEEFINFVHRPDIYKQIAQAYPAVCLNDEAKKIMGSDFLDNPGSNVDEGQLARAHFTQDVGDAATYYDDVYTKMKSE